MVYSESLDALLCKYCVLFDNQPEEHGPLVRKGFSLWTKAKKNLNEHFKGITTNETESKGSGIKKKRQKRPKGYVSHLNNKEKAYVFLQSYSGKQKTVPLLMDNQRAENFERNVRVLESLIKVAHFCGQQVVAFRGHRDSRADCEKTENNPGNFYMLLKLCAELGNSTLAEHLESTRQGNASYTSKTIQNEIIEAFEHEIRGRILAEVRQAHFFSVMADECTDVSNKEQLTICLRYVDEHDKIHEEFIEFVHCDRGITGAALADKIVHSLKDKHGLNMYGLRGQCFDGASNMSGSKKGTAARITEIYPKAPYTWCNAHKLNLCVVKSCENRLVRNMIDRSSEVGIFFNYSPARQNILKDKIEEYYKRNRQTDALYQMNQRQKKKKLKLLCKTRWVERHDAYTTFIELYVPLIETLEYIGENTNDFTRDTVSKATSHLRSLTEFEFIITLV